MREVILLAVGSSTFQNLQQRLQQQVMSKVIKFLPNHEMPLLYISENKILALEDCINFFPSMFKLVKSIVVSEPL